MQPFLRRLTTCMVLWTSLAGLATAQTGELWTNTLKGKAGLDAAGKATLVRGARAYTSGVSVATNVFAPGNASLAWTVRAVKPSTGEVIWEAVSDLTLTNNESADALALAGPRLFVGGTYENDTTGNTWLVRARNARSGELLWEREISRSSNDQLFNLAANKSRVLVAGTSGETNTDWLIVALDAKTGAVLWETTSGLENVDDPIVSGPLALGSKTVSVVGSILNDDGDLDAIARTYALSDGSFLWDDRISSMTGFDSLAGGVAASKTTVVMVGGRAVNFLGMQRWYGVVRAYDASSGKLIWSNLISASPLFDDSKGFEHVAIARGTVVAAGSFVQFSFETDPQPEGVNVMQAFRLSDGKIQWDDRQDSGSTVSGTPPGVSTVGALSVTRRLAVTSGTLDGRPVARAVSTTSGALKAKSLNNIFNPTLLGSVGDGFSVGSSGRRVVFIGTHETGAETSWFSSGLRD